MSTWFFHRPTSNPAEQKEEDEGRLSGPEIAAAASGPEEGAEGTEQLTRRRSSGLKDLLLKQFTARSDFRDLNLGVPQSM